ncbi:MAG: segregation/condensation protein A, partial [Cyanobacteria bacterium J06638_6]
PVMEFLLELLRQHGFDQIMVNVSHLAETVHEKVGVFWGLLFLSAQSKVEMAQDNFYGDLRVRNLNRVPLTAEEAELPAFVLPD